MNDRGRSAIEKGITCSSISRGDKAGHEQNEEALQRGSTTDLDVVPPIHFVSNNEATDKLTTQYGGMFTN